MGLGRAADSGLQGFQFLAGGVLKEVHQRLQEARRGAFSPGRPAQFLLNYHFSLAFLDFLEGAARLVLAAQYWSLVVHLPWLCCGVQSARKVRTALPFAVVHPGMLLVKHSAAAAGAPRSWSSISRSEALVRSCAWGCFSGFCSSEAMLMGFRGHPSYEEFMRSWNLPAYYAARCAHHSPLCP